MTDPEHAAYQRAYRIIRGQQSTVVIPVQQVAALAATSPEARALLNAELGERIVLVCERVTANGTHHPTGSGHPIDYGTPANEQKENPMPDNERPVQDGPSRFRKKPVTIEAVQFRHDLTGPEAHSIYQWIERNTAGSFNVNELWTDPENFTWPESGVSIDARDGRMVIATLEGGHWVDLDDWIIRGVNGEFYPCKPDVFAKTYEPADDAITVGDRVSTRPRRRMKNPPDDLDRLYMGTVAEVVPAYKVAIDAGGHETVPAESIILLDGDA